MIGDFEIPRIQDKELNDAILNCDISSDFLPFIELCHRYYADEIDWSVDESPRRTIARDELQGMLMEFLLPIHLVAEMGGVQVNVEACEIASDTPDQQHSSWSVEFLAKSGTRHAISWKTMRTWIAHRTWLVRMHARFARPMFDGDCRLQKTVGRLLMQSR